MLPRSIFVLLIGLLLVLLACPAWAQTDQERAVELANEAQSAFVNRDYAIAAQKYAQAYGHYPDHSLQMNEMVSWYKAARCDEALAVAGRIIDGRPTLSEQDQEDLDKVHLECGYLEAQRMFDAGDLDAAETRLALVETTDLETAGKIGVLRGKIEERRKLLASQQNDNNTQDPVLRDKAPEPITAPPDWMRLAGMGLVAGGVVGAIAVAIKYFAFERRALNRNQQYYDEQHQCDFVNADNPDDECTTEQVGDDANALQTARNGVKVAEVTNVLFGGLSGAGVAVGAGFIVYYYLRQARWEESQRVDAPVVRALLLPDVGRDRAGLTLVLQF